MCDYCSCRSMPVIQDLGTEHEALLALSGRIGALVGTGDRLAAAAALAALAEQLQRHNDVEEASIFAGLRAAGEMVDRVEALTAEHGVMREAIDGLEGLDGRVWDDAVRSLLADLQDHISQEEYDLFPATLMAIGPGGWDAVETATAEARHRGA